MRVGKDPKRSIDPIQIRKDLNMKDDTISLEAQKMNEKIAELIKSASPHEIAVLLKDENSLISPMHNNNNQNGSPM